MTSKQKHRIEILAAIVTILVCIVPMGWFPMWNGEIPQHRNQYERVTEAFLEGHLYMTYGDEELLMELNNPYDFDERCRIGAGQWDHAFYDGHYYMYFGVIPVLLVFLPFRVLTGQPLTTYHATQLFVALAIIGIFALFYMLRQLFFQQMPYRLYLCLCIAFSIMSFWYSAAEPALYCTAITSAIALEIWSLYFYIRAVWKCEEENRQILHAGIGALLGAFTFGCRPSIGVANILVLPMLYVFLQKKEKSVRLLVKLVIAALPYVVVAAGLMWYNYVRFDNPFEFGQAYQLTVTDQTGYRFSFDLPTIWKVIKGNIRYYFWPCQIEEAFPFLSPGGIFISFPILLFCVKLFDRKVWKKMKQNKLLPLMIGFVVVAFLIVAMTVVMVPYLLERYHSDTYFLAAIACFMVIGVWSSEWNEQQTLVYSKLMLGLSVLTIVSSLVFYLQLRPWFVG